MRIKLMLSSKDIQQSSEEYNEDAKDMFAVPGMNYELKRYQFILY